MRGEQRTEDLAYEVYGELEAPSGPPPLLAEAAYRAQFERDSPFPLALSRRLYSAAGIGRFLWRLHEEPGEYERMLRTQDVRLSMTSLLALNATLALEDDEAHPEMCQRAAALVVAAWQFFEDLLGGRQSVDRHRGAPLEMGQYGNLFSTCLRPRGACRRVFKPPHSDFVVVVAGGTLHRLELGPQGARRSAEELRLDLELVARVAPRGSQARRAASTAITSAGYLERVAGTNLLRLDPDNRRTLDTVSRALFVLCLDLESRPLGVPALARSIHATESWNRWHMASLQIVVTANARAGMMTSFPCGLDGNVVVRFAAQVQRTATAMRWAAAPAGARTSGVAPLPLRAPEGLVARAHASTRTFLRDDADHFFIPGIGDRLFRSCGISSDGAFTLALLFALQRLEGRNACIMEHVSQAQFRNMGVSMAAVSTDAAVAFVELVAGGRFDPARAFELLQRASDAHRSVMREARSSMPLKWLALHFVRRTHGLVTIPAFLVALASGATRYDCIISQPRTEPEVVACGRPGIRMPVVDVVAAHYYLHDGHTEVIYMPSSRTSLSAAAIHAELEDGMRLVADVARHREP
jgi:hypothetical protein